MIRKTLTILSLIGLLLSVGLWGVSYCNILYAFPRSQTLQHVLGLRDGACQLLLVAHASVADNLLAGHYPERAYPCRINYLQF